MRLAQHLRTLQQQWYVILLIVVVSLCASAGYTVSRTPMYAADTKMFVSVSTSDTDATQLSQGSAFTQQRIKSYADVVTSQAVLDGVVERLRLPEDATKLAKSVSVEAPLETVVLNVTVQDPNPQRAADIANEIARQFPTYVTALETPPGETKSPVKVTVTDRAAVPTAPVSPRVPINLAFGLLIGLVLGVAGAVLRDQLNTSVSGVADIEDLTGAVPLVVVPFAAAAADQPLVLNDQQGNRAEIFRTLRTNLQFANVDNPPQIIVVTSAMPEEGKSTVASNVALTLALAGTQTLLIDGDLRKPAVGSYFGISDSAGLSSVLAGRHELNDVVVLTNGSLSVLPSGPTPPNPSELLGSQQMAELISTMADRFEVIIIDAPPLLPVTDAAVLAAKADGAVLVVRNGKTRREAVQNAIHSLEAVNARLLGTVLNFAPRRKKDLEMYAAYGPAPSRRANVVVEPVRGVAYPDRRSGAGLSASESFPVNGHAPSPIREDEPSYRGDQGGWR